jgi:hypothetical protein
VTRVRTAPNETAAALRRCERALGAEVTAGLVVARWAVSEAASAAPSSTAPAWHAAVDAACVAALHCVELALALLDRAAGGTVEPRTAALASARDRWPPQGFGTTTAGADAARPSASGSTSTTPRMIGPPSAPALAWVVTEIEQATAHALTLLWSDPALRAAARGVALRDLARLATHVCGDAPSGAAWLDADHPALGDRPPRAVAAGSAAGLARVRRLLVERELARVLG